jgi:hypothetical protein
VSLDNGQNLDRWITGEAIQMQEAASVKKKENITQVLQR